MCECGRSLEKAKDKADGQRILNVIELPLKDSGNGHTTRVLTCPPLRQAISGEAPAVPGDASFPISVVYPAANNANEKKEFGKMLTQLRKETASRLPDIVFDDPAGPASKWWLSFAKRKFLNKNL